MTTSAESIEQRSCRARVQHGADTPAWTRSDGYERDLLIGLSDSTIC